MSKTPVEDEKFDDEFKIIVLGDPSAGKTPFIIRYTTGFFLEDKITTGVDFYSKITNFKERKVKLQFWDFGQDERFRFLLHQYSKGAHAAMFIYDITNSLSLDHLSAWILPLRECAGEIPIILVGIKLDLEADREVSWERGVFAMRQYALSAFYETSMKTGQNFDSIFSDLLSILFEVHHNIPFENKQKFDFTTIEKNLLKLRIVKLATTLESLLLGLEPHKDSLSDIFSSYQVDLFRKIKENPDDPIVQRMVMNHIVAQEGRKESALSDSLSICESNGENIPMNKQKPKAKELPSPESKAYYKLELDWLYRVRSNLLTKMKARIDQYKKKTIKK